MLKSRHNNTPLLRTWIFDKPAMFALLSLGLMFITIFCYSLIASISKTSNGMLLFSLVFMALAWSIYHLIKKLPNGVMPRRDFIAIVNACSVIATFVPLITLLVLGRDFAGIKHKFMVIHATHPVFLWLTFLCIALLYLYVFGVIISGIYAKYKRAREMKISKWKIICSFPFAFLLMWTPGYLINDKNTDSNLTIKSSWYSKFSKWVIAKNQNTLVTFLILILLLDMFSGLASLLLAIFLLMIYALWRVKHKKNFLKNINRGYALSAVSINITIIFVLLLQALTNLH